MFVAAFASVWESVALLTTLFNGYVLMAVPAAVGKREDGRGRVAPHVV